FFRFPNVEVGCVLEYVYTFEQNDWIWTQIERWISDTIPVYSYQFEMRITKDLKYGLRAFNTGGKDIERTDLGSMWRLTLNIEDVAPRTSREWRAPHRTLAASWIYFQVRRVENERQEKEYNTTWAHASRYVGRWLYLEREFFDDFDDPLSPPPCDEMSCVQEILYSVHADVVLDRWGERSGTRNMNDVLADGWGSGWEKSLL